MKIKNRQSIRLPIYNYAQTGAYFITLVTFERECLFGEIDDGTISLSPLGRIAAEQWRRLPARFPNWLTDSFGIMPNHVHGVLFKPAVSMAQERGEPTTGVASPDIPIIPEGSLRPYTSPCCDSLGAIIRAYKSAVTFRYHQTRAGMELPLWQRNYYEHIVRDEDDLDRIRHYIIKNPLRWAEDKENIKGAQGL